MRAVILSTSFIALTAAAQMALAQTQEAYCLESPGGARNCSYESLERCQQMAGRSIGGRCITNPALTGTTGAGGMDAPRGTGPHSLDRVPAPIR
jgi:hypothetical protein